MSTVAQHTFLLCEQRSTINQRFSTELVEMSTAPNRLLEYHAHDLALLQIGPICNFCNALANYSIGD